MKIKKIGLTIGILAFLLFLFLAPTEALWLVFGAICTLTIGVSILAWFFKIRH